MCDCFHVVLPTWPGAPGSVSGRQLQPEEPGAATEEDRTVTEGPVDEVIRPRPQGSSPVYECTAEGTGFGVQEDAPGRRGSSGRRRSWWKRASGDSQVFSRMSHPEAVREVTEETLETEVEAGASGYSVTGGGHQGIFVKQVLKDSSAAKLFSLREGDQLLSATIFFDDIKYEDALKILQYSEPYKIQFRIKRKLRAPEGEELAVSGPWQDSKDKEQDKDVADECTETPTKTLEADGDRERLISKPRESRGRRPHERLSWPKFQALKSKRGPGPRRSHSSSEAHEPGDARDVSPTSTDTEAQLQEELRAQKAGPGRQRRRKFLNFRFKMGSGQEPSAAGQLGREAHGRPHPAGVLGEMGPWEDGPGATGAPEGGRPEERAEWQGAGPPVQQGVEPGPPAHVLGDRAPAEGVGMAARGQREIQPMSTQHKAEEHSKPRSGTGAGRGMSWEQEWEEIQSLETGIARLSLLDTQDAGSSQTHGPETQVQGRDLKTPKFGISKEKVTETGKGGKGLEEKKGKQTSPGEDEGGRTEATAEEDTSVGTGPQADAARRKEQKEKTPKTRQDKGETQKDEDPERREAKVKVPRAPGSSTGRSPSRDGRASPPRAGGEGKREMAREDRRATRGPHAVGPGDALPGEEQEQRQVGATQKRDAATTEENIKKGHRDQDAGEGQLRRPTFKMPSFSGSAVGPAWDASVEVRAPQAEADVALPSTQGDLKSSDLSIQLPATNLDTRDGQLDVTLPKATLPEGELLADADSGAGLKGHLPKMQMPSIKMPKVDLKGPQVTIKGPKLDVKGRKGEVSAPSLDMELSAGKMDIQAPSAQLEGDLALADKEVATKDGKFKMPKFKMPSFGISGPSKTLDTSVEVNLPKVEADVTLTSIQGDLKDPDLRMQLPEANVDIRAGQMDMTVPEATLLKKELLAAPDAEAGLKGHKPKVQMPSIKMPKVDVKGPQVDFKGPKQDMKGPKVEVCAPDLDMELPSGQVDIQAPSAKLEGDLAQADKEVATKDSKFKMPKFKMPSFGASTPSKTLDTSMEVKGPKAEAEVSLPSIQSDLKTSELSIQMPTADLEAGTGQVDLTLPKATLPKGELPAASPAGASLKGHLPKVQIPSIKMPKVDLKGPQVDIKGPKLDVKDNKGEVNAPDRDGEQPSVQVDIQAPGAKVEGALALADKDVTTKEGKIKMPKFKRPSFSLSAPSKTLDTSVEVKAPEVEADVALPSIQGDLKTSDLSIQLPTANLEAGDSQGDVTLPKTTLPEGEQPPAPPARASLKGHLPKVQMPSIKMPKVDLKGPQLDIKGPKLDVKRSRGEVSGPDLDMELPSGQVDIQAPSAKLEGDLTLADKEVATKDSKFKMPKFRMSSFGMSAPVKTLDTSMEVKAPKVEVDVAVPSIQGDLKTSDISIQLPPAEIGDRAGQVDVTLPEATLLPKEELPAALADGASLKGQVPKMQMPSIRMPKVDLKGPQVDIKGPKQEVKGPKVEVSAPDLDMELPSGQVDMQAPRAKLEGDLAPEDKEVDIKDSKFKMPKFKMPSFGVSTPSKTLDTSMEVKGPKAEADVSLPSIQSDLKTSDLSIQLPAIGLEAGTGKVDVTLPEATLSEGEIPASPSAGAKLKGHLPKMQMPSIKKAKVDLKGPQLDIMGPKLEVKGTKGEVSTPVMDVEQPSVQMDIQAPGAKVEGDLALADKDVTTKEGKFKMPKFKMPSLGVSTPGKALDTSVEVKVAKVEADVTLPSIHGDLKSSDLSIQLPTAALNTRDGQEDVTLYEATLPEGELLAAPDSGPSLKGHLPKVQMPSIKMPKVDLKGPQVDIKGPKLDVKRSRGEVSGPDLDMELPSGQVDIQAPSAKLEGDLALADKEVATKDSKFKMPKFRMPSFGMSAPVKTLDTSVKVKAPKVEVDVALPSIQGDLKTSDISIQLPPAEMGDRAGQVDVTLPEATLPKEELPAAPADGASLKGQVPKGQMPSIKMPKVDLKGPQVDIKGPKQEVKGPKVEVSAPDLDMELPSGQVDIQAPSAKLEGDLAPEDKEVDIKDSKFKMPKFKMPSFGVSTPSKTLDTTMEVKGPKAEADVSLPSIQSDLKTSDISIQMPTADLEAGTGQVDVTLPEVTLSEGEIPASPSAGAKLKGHLPKVQMPSIKMPKVDLKGPQVDIKGPKLDIKEPKVEVSVPDFDMELPSVQVDIEAPGAKLEGDLALADKEVATRDSKFKMPKFKMPSFGISAPGKTLDMSMEVKAPKVEVDVALPSIQGDLKTSDISIQMPPAEMGDMAGQVDVTLPEATLPKEELPAAPADGASLKGQVPKGQMPSIKMPKVDLKDPQVDVKGPKLDVKGIKGRVSAPDRDVEQPSLQVDIQVPGAKVEGDLALADKDVATKEDKFKMPKFKMPSLGVSALGKALDASVEVKVPKVEDDVALPSTQGDLTSSDLSIQLPTADLDTRDGQVYVTLHEVPLPEGELPVAPDTKSGLKGHQPKVQMPCMKMPKVDIKGPQVDIKGPNLDVKGSMGGVSGPNLDMELPSGQVDIQAPSAKLEGDLARADKKVATRDSKFKRPKFKMPSFGISVPGKTLDTSMEVKGPKEEAYIALPSIQGDLKASDLSIQLPTTGLEAGTGKVDVTLPEATLSEGEIPASSSAKLKGHLPKMQMPSIKMPKVDLKGPQLDIKGPKLEVKGTKGEVSAPDLDMELPSGQMHIQAPSAKLEGDLALADKEVAIKDSKFEMPKFKMPSFGVSATGKMLDTSVEVKAPKVEADVALPSIQGDLKTSDISIQLPTANLEAGDSQADVTLPKTTLPEGEQPPAPPARTSLKGHLPKVQMPSIKMPKVDLKGPQVDFKGPKLDVKRSRGEVSGPDLDMELPSGQVDIQAPSAKLEGDLTLADKEVATKDSKFKMPKFRMSSFGMSAPVKTLDTSMEVKAPKVEVDVAVPSIQSDLKTSDISIQLPPAEIGDRAGQVDVTLPEATLLPKEELPAALADGASLKGQVLKVQMPSIRMPKVDLKGPQVDIKGPKVEVKGPKVEVSAPDLDMELPSGQVDIQAPSAKLEGDLALADKEVDIKDSKFKMPKFKMPSFDVSTPSKTLDTSMEVKAPTAEADVSLPSIQSDLKTSELSIQMPTADLDAGTGQVDLTLPKATLSKGELPAAPPAGASLKGHLPKVQIPSIKMPKVDLKEPQVDVRGPKLDIKGSKVEDGTPDFDMELPSIQVDRETPSAKLEGDLAQADKEVDTKDSKFKRPKFKVPSFGISAPGKTLDASVEVKGPKVEVDVSLPSIQGDLKASDLSIQLPTTGLEAGTGKVDVTLPEATLSEGEIPASSSAGAKLKGHLPKMQMPSIKKAKVDLKGPQLDIKGPKLDVKGTKGELSAPDLDMELPSGQVHIQAPSAKLEGDLALADKEKAIKDSKFEMPKFKMPSFGVSATGKMLDTSVEVKAPKVEADVALPSIQGDLKTSDISIQLPTANLEAGDSQADVTLPKTTLPEGEQPPAPPAGASLKGHLPKVQMPSIKMPKVDLKGPQVDFKGPKLDVKRSRGEVSGPDLDMELPSGQVDIQAPSAKLEGDLALADKEVATKDSKFKMPKFKMPSFGVSTPSKTLDTSMEVKGPKAEAEVSLPSIQSDLKTSELSIQMPTADLEAGTGQVDLTQPKATLPKGELPAAPPAGASLKGHLPKVQIPSIKMPKVDLKGPQLDIKGPKLEVKGTKGEVSTPVMDVEQPSVQMDIQAPGAKVEGDLALADKDVTTREGKFKMPKFKMPSLGVSASGKALDTSVEVKVAKVEADVTLPSIHGDLKSSDLSIQLPTAALNTRDGQEDVTLYEATLPEGELLAAPDSGPSLKGHLPKVQMPSIKMPKVDLKGPQVDIKGPKLEVKGPKSGVRSLDLEMELPSGQVDKQAPSAKLEGDLALADKEVATKDSKFKMPTFKMPSFGMSATGKALDASVDIKVPKVEADVALPSTQGDLMSSELSIQLPTADLDTRDGQVGVTLHDSPLPKEELPGEPDIKSGLKGHQPKVQMPSIKMPKVDLKGPQVDIKGPKVEVKSPKVEVRVPDLDVELPSGQVDIQTPNTKLEGDLTLEEKDEATKDSKLKMPKFKMPSFGISVPGKTLDASVEVKGPKVVTGVALPSIQSDLKTPDLSIHLPTADLETQAGQVDVTFSEATLPKKELPVAPASGVGLKGHLPKVQMPSIKMPKVDLKGSQVDVKGPKLDVKGTKGEVSTPDLMLEQPSVQVDIQAPGAKVEGDLALADKDVATKEGKFKMLKFKMPSLGMSAPGKALDTSVEVKAPKVEVDVTLSSTHGDLKSSDFSIQLPSADLDRRDGHVDMTLHETAQPEGELLAAPDSGASLKGHLPKVHMPSIKMPKVDLKGPKLDVKGSKGKVSVPDLEMELPSMQVDIQTPSANLEGDLALLEKDVATKEGKFKMPKFKMPSVGLSAPGKALDTSVEVKVPKMQADVDMPSIEGNLKDSDLCRQLPDTDLDSRALQVDVILPEATLPEEELLVASAAVSSLKGHLPKVQMPSIKMPKVDLKEPQVDVKGPKLDIKGSKGKVSTPDLELPSVQVDIQTPGAQLEGDLAQADKEVATKDSKFKMPKFKMPFFGLSAPSKALDTSVEVKRPKVEADVALPSIQGDLKGSDLSSQLSATDLEAGAGQADVTLPKPTLLEGELQAAPDSGIGLKGHLPKMQMTSIKIPKVDLKGPLVDVKGPKGKESTPNLDMELPSMEVDIQAPSAQLEGDLALADKEVATKDSKFKMPKFKIPSFGLLAPGKALDASVEVKVPKVEANVTLPSIQGDIKSSELSIQLPTDHLQAGPGEVDVTLSEAALPEGELPVATVSGVDLKGHVPQVQMPSIKVPQVDVKGPQVDTKGPKLEVKSPKDEVIPSELDVEQPSVQVDTQAPGTKLEGGLAGAEDLAPEDIKLESGDVDTSFSKRESELTFHRPHFKFSKLFSPHKKSPRGTAGVEEAPGACLLRVSPTSSSQVPGVESEERTVSGVTSSVESPSVLTSDLPFARADGVVGHAGPPVVPGSERPSLSQPPEACFPPGSSAECPQASCSPQQGAPSAGSESSVVCVSSPEHQSGPEDPEPPAFHARVTFPKFHKPKFGFSCAAAAVAEADSCAAEDSPGLSLLCPVEGVDSLGEGAVVTGLPASQPLSSGVPESPGREEHLGPAVVGGPAEAADRDGKGSPFKMPRLKLPSFSRSPKKQAVVTGDPGGHPEDATLSLVLETDEMHTQPTVQVPPTEAQMHLHSEKEAEKGRSRKPALAMPRLPLPRRKASKARESLPPGDTDAALSSTTDGPDSEATERASGDGGQGDIGMTAGPLEGDGGHVQVPQAHPPSLGFDKPKVEVEVEVSLSKADLHLPQHDLAIRGDSQESRLGDLSMSQSPGERMAHPEDVPTVERPDRGTATRAAPADSQAHWFRMPTLRVPGFRRSSSKEQGGPREQDTAEAAPDPGSMAEASVSPRPLEAQMEGAAPESESYADVPRRPLESPSLQLHFPTAPGSESGLPSPGGGGRTHPAIDPLPLQIPGVRPSAPLAPPGEARGEPLSRPGGCDLAQAEVRTEMWSFQPQGPLKLKASSTDVPSQVSVVNVNQLWEDSVLTVTFPKLKVPRFSFPVPSSEADVFFPVVRAVPCTEAGPEVDLLQDSPGLWGASLLRASGTVVPGEQPEGPDLSSEVSPVSKVRVHIQESQGESQGVTICSNVQGECSDMAAPKASSTQIVRESEIPTSTVQMASYGFSLLKVKIPELPAQASTYTIAQDSAAGEPSGGSPGGDTVPGDPQPDTGEPFEMISGSANLLGPPTFPSEAGSGLQLADSGSDEEPAEILEFPLDDRPEAATLLAGEDRAPKEKPEGKKSSGLLWSWLPNIGFSSTSETSANARDDAQRSAPIQTQPGARPDPEPEKKQDRAGWFRFPRLGFSSSPAKKGKSLEEEAGLPGQKLQEETVTFFDARESFSPEEEDDEVAAGAAGARLGSRVMVASSARTELILLEDSKSAGEGPVPRPTTE
ncbi:protein AHNAK2 [Urocitellus parryii]